MTSFLSFERLLLAGFLCLSACAAPTAADETDETEASADEKADAESELRVRAGETSLWVDRVLARSENENGAQTFVLRGRTSRDIVDGRAYIIDDIYGDWRARGTRSFEASWTTTELATLVHGVSQFIGLSFRPSSGRPSSLTARVVVRPRLAGMRGASALYVTAELTPVVSGGRTVFRIRGRADRPLVGAPTVRVGDVALSDVRLVDDTHFEADLLLEHLVAAAGTRTEIAIDINLGGTTFTKRATLELSVTRLGFTSGDAYAKWPRPECTTEMRDCLSALPAGETDLAACGEAIAVNACAGRVGVTVDEATVQDALSDAATHFASGGDVTRDAPLLVGPSRATAFVEAARLATEESLQQQLGRWYPSLAVRDEALAAATEDALATVYARPLDYVAPLVRDPSDPQSLRDAAADGLLQYISTFDFRPTLYGRTTTEIVRASRAQHAEEVGFFRTQAMQESWSPDPAWVNFAGRWMSSYVESRVDRTTGEPADLFFEID